MPDFPIIDAHVHLWDLSLFRYPWLDRNPRINRTFLLPDYNLACGSLQVEKMVFMQCECLPEQYQEEVRWVTQMAIADEPRIAGIVSWAPLDRGEAARPALEELAGNKLVKGVRQIIRHDGDLEFCLRPDFIKGVQMLPEYGLTFDLGINWQDNPNVLRLVGKCPDVRFILDHIGSPDLKNQRLDPWRAEITALAEFPNVFCKVSSLATGLAGRPWTIEDLKPFADQIFACFGFDRTVYAGDWPVSSLAASLPVCVATLEQLVSGCSEGELRKLFHDNAGVFYGV